MKHRHLPFAGTFYDSKEFKAQAKRIEELTELLKEGQSLMREHRDRIIVMESIVTDAFRIFDKYLNVPEAHELRERWAKLKAQ